jgi:hypothetical protein
MTKHDFLVSSGVLGGNAAWILKRAPEEVAMSTLLRALRVVLGQRGHITLARLAANLGFDAPTLLSP